MKNIFFLIFLLISLIDASKRKRKDEPFENIIKKQKTFEKPVDLEDVINSIIFDADFRTTLEKFTFTSEADLKAIFVYSRATEAKKLIFLEYIQQVQHAVNMIEFIKSIFMFGWIEVAPILNVCDNKTRQAAILTKYKRDSDSWEETFAVLKGYRWKLDFPTILQMMRSAFDDGHIDFLLEYFKFNPDPFKFFIKEFLVGCCKESLSSNLPKLLEAISDANLDEHVDWFDLLEMISLEAREVGPDQLVLLVPRFIHIIEGNSMIKSNFIENIVFSNFADEIDILIQFYGSLSMNGLKADTRANLFASWASLGLWGNFRSALTIYQLDTLVWNSMMQLKPRMITLDNFNSFIQIWMEFMRNNGFVLLWNALYDKKYDEIGRVKLPISELNCPMLLSLISSPEALLFFLKSFDPCDIPLEFLHTKIALFNQGCMKHIHDVIDCYFGSSPKTIEPQIILSLSNIIPILPDNEKLHEQFLALLLSTKSFPLQYMVHAYVPEGPAKVMASILKRYDENSFIEFYGNIENVKFLYESFKGRICEYLVQSTVLIAKQKASKEVMLAAADEMFKRLEELYPLMKSRVLFCVKHLQGLFSVHPVPWTGDFCKHVFSKSGNSIVIFQHINIAMIKAFNLDFSFNLLFDFLVDCNSAKVCDSHTSYLMKASNEFFYWLTIFKQLQLDSSFFKVLKEVLEILYKKFGIIPDSLVQILIFVKHTFGFDFARDIAKVYDLSNAALKAKLLISSATLEEEGLWMIVDTAFEDDELPLNFLMTKPTDFLLKKTGKMIKKDGYGCLLSCRGIFNPVFIKNHPELHENFLKAFFWSPQMFFPCAIHWNNLVLSPKTKIMSEMLSKMMEPVEFVLPFSSSEPWSTLQHEDNELFLVKTSEKVDWKEISVALKIRLFTARRCNLGQITISSAQIVSWDEMNANLLTLLEEAHLFWKSSLHVVFEDSQSTGPGPVKHWMDQACSLYSSKLFIVEKGYLIPRIDMNGNELLNFGLLLGLALANDIKLNLPLHPVVWKVLSGCFELSDEDLISLDSDFFHGLHAEEIEQYDLYYEFIYQGIERLGHVNPASIRKDNVNYYKRDAKAFLATAMMGFLEPIAKVFLQTIPKDLREILLDDHQFLPSVLLGFPSYDLKDWKANTRCIDSNEHAVKWFWEIVESMSEEERRGLVRFVTGSAYIPVGGFSKLCNGRFTISFTDKGFLRNELGVERNLNDGVYPTSSTCSNILHVPLYSTKIIMEAALKVIILDHSMVKE